MKKLLTATLALILLCAPAMAEIGLTEFSATDLQGKEVNQAIFAAYDLTMVNIWATWCDFCINELPELAKLQEALPDNVNLITICEDAESEAALAKQMIRNADAEFITIIPNDEIHSQLLSHVYAFPTTVFLDRDGMMVGDAIIGVPSLENSAKAYASIFKDTLELLEN